MYRIVLEIVFDNRTLSRQYTECPDKFLFIWTNCPDKSKKRVCGSTKVCGSEENGGEAGV